MDKCYRRKNFYNGLNAAVLLATFVLLDLKLRVSGQTPARCSPDVVGSGSGDSSQMICGDNSICLNSAFCECVTNFFSPTGTNTDCRNLEAPDSRCSVPNCVYCGSNFNQQCLKCVNVIYSGQCLSECPYGTQLRVYTLNTTNLAVRECVGAASTRVLQEWAVIVIIVLGVVVLMVIAILIAAVACTCLRRSNVGQLDIAERQAQQRKLEIDQEDVDVHENMDETNAENAIEEHFEPGDYNYNISEEERKEFFSMLETLRDQSEVFLKMLNDMRRRLKELQQNSPAVQQYKNVMRDLTRLLYMLNKKPEKVRIPPDGIQLLTWSKQLLNRYLVAQGKSPISSSPVRSTSPTTSSPERFSTIGDTAETDF